MNFLYVYKANTFMLFEDASVYPTEYASVQRKVKYCYSKTWYFKIMSDNLLPL